MALVFMDNFAGYAPATIGAAWGSASRTDTMTFQTGGPVGSGHYLSITSAVTSLTSPAFTATSVGVLGFRYRFTGAGSVGYTRIAAIHSTGWQSGAGSQIELRLNADGTLEIVRGGIVALTGGTSVLSISVNVWHYIELKFEIANSVGAATTTLTVDGVVWATVATGQDTQALAGSTVNGFSLLYQDNVTGAAEFTDVYFKDDATLLGDSTISVLTPSGNGTTQQFTSSGGGHYTDVDDMPHTADTDYVESSTNGHVELFSMGNLTVTPVTIHALAPCNLVRKTDGGAKTARSVIRSGGTNYGQADFAATDSYKYDCPIAVVDPATAAAWTASNINAVELGVEVRS